MAPPRFLHVRAATSVSKPRLHLRGAGAGVPVWVATAAWTTATLALVAAALSASRSFLRPEENAELHGLKGDRFISLRNDAIRFQQIDLRSSLSLDALNDRGRV